MASVQGAFHALAELGLGIRQSVLCKGRDFAAPQPLPLSPPCAFSGAVWFQGVLDRRSEAQEVWDCPALS